MRISTRGHYGLRAMLDLALAYEEGPMALNDIAQKENLSAGYLEQLLRRLGAAGLLKSSRGAHGGYTLSAEPASITVGQVLRVLEGPIAPADCASELPGSEGPCARERICASRLLWQRMRDSIIQVLDSTTLADLCRELSEEAVRDAVAAGGKDLCQQS